MHSKTALLLTTTLLHGLLQPTSSLPPAATVSRQDQLPTTHLARYNATFAWEFKLSCCKLMCVGC